MLVKILLITLFAACQAAKNEPWWIQMFFPNVSFTGKYHPSNYKVEKSPLFPDSVQNPNDVWSPAYWMPYKQAYSQYWIDLIENATKAEEEKDKEAQAQAGQDWSGYQNGQYGAQGQYDQGQYGTDDQYGQYNQYGVGDQYGQYGLQNGNSGYYGENDQYGSNAPTPDQAIVQEANSIAENVQTQAEKMNGDAAQIISQAQQEAQKEMFAVAEDANKKKQEVAAEAQLVSGQAEEVSAQIDKAAAAKIEAIVQETSQFEADIKRQFAPLYKEAEEIALKAAEIAEDLKSNQN